MRDRKIRKDKIYTDYETYFTYLAKRVIRYIWFEGEIKILVNIYISYLFLPGITRADFSIYISVFSPGAHTEKKNTLVEGLLRKKKSLQRLNMKRKL